MPSANSFAGKVKCFRMDDRTTRSCVTSSRITSPRRSRRVQDHLQEDGQPSRRHDPQHPWRTSRAGYLAQPHTSGARPHGRGFRTTSIISCRADPRPRRDGPAPPRAGEGTARRTSWCGRSAVCCRTWPTRRASSWFPRRSSSPALREPHARGGGEDPSGHRDARGWVQHRLIQGERDLTGDELERSAHISTSWPRADAAAAARPILAELNKEKARYDRVMGRASHGRRALADALPAKSSSRTRETSSNSPSSPTTSTPERILRAFEEKSVIFRLLDRAMESRASRCPSDSRTRWKSCGHLGGRLWIRQGASSVGSIASSGPSGWTTPG